VRLVTGFAAEAVMQDATGLVLSGTVDGAAVTLPPVDEIVVATGQRPDLDPNVHSCGSVPPHGHRELAHHEPGFYTIGVKSYGRAPTFLLLTGYEQARSVVAAIAGDLVAADHVHLVLPETGICQTDFAEGTAACCSAPSAATPEAPGCCGGPAVVMEDACCVADEVARSEGKKGCGCGAA